MVTTRGCPGEEAKVYPLRRCSFKPGRCPAAAHFVLRFMALLTFNRHIVNNLFSVRAGDEILLQLSS